MPFFTRDREREREGGGSLVILMDLVFCGYLKIVEV
jgi:hypothetical protein